METEVVYLGSQSLVDMELWLEVINLALALWVLWIAYTTQHRVKGVVGHVWNLLALAVVAFAVVEMMGILGLSGVVDFAGWTDLAELVLIGSLLVMTHHLKKVK